jgi:hypothetical protein
MVIVVGLWARLGSLGDSLRDMEPAARERALGNRGEQRSSIVMTLFAGSEAHDGGRMGGAVSIIEPLTAAFVPPERGE